MRTTLTIDDDVLASQVTDSYLLALAQTNRGQLASFDRRLVTGAVRGHRYALHFI